MIPVKLKQCHYCGVFDETVHREQQDTVNKCLECREAEIDE